MARVRGREVTGPALVAERDAATARVARRLFGEPSSPAEEAAGFAAVRRKLAELRQRKPQPQVGP